jgi:choline dehydrogenase-like flavoprotein
MEAFDFVVAGGGSGGCAVASRLSEDAATSVALLEAGGRDDNWVVNTPGAMLLQIAGKVNNWAFHTVPQKGLKGRIGYQPRGKGLGGSSATNAMVYIRGHRTDYDHWAALGSTGWSYADVLPISNAQRTIPNSMAPITARVARSMSRACEPTTQCATSICRRRERPNSASARISMQRSRRGLAPTRLRN